MTCRDFHRFWSARPEGELPPGMQQHLAACPACAAMARADAATAAGLRQLTAVPPPIDLDHARAAILQKLAAESDRPPLECGGLTPLFSLPRPKTWVGGTGSRQSGEPVLSHHSEDSGIKPPHSKEADASHPIRGPWLAGRHRLVWAAAGLTATAVAAALLLLPDGTPQPERPRTIANDQNRPGPSPENPAPPIELPQRKLTPQVAEDPRPSGTNKKLQPAPPQLDTGPTPPVAPAPPKRSAPDGTLRLVHNPPRLTPEAQQPIPDSTPGSWIQVITALPPSPRRASDGERGHDLHWLNEGPLADVQPAAPRAPSVPVAVVSPPVQERRPGSVLVDDLLHLNPVRVAAADDEGLGAGLRALAGQDPTTDARLQQKVTVHATDERIADLLAWLSKATGVPLMARLEVADERVTLWATDRPLIDVMRDLRHLRGLYWSRAKRGGEWVYSLWQDAQGQAREEAELNRMAIELQREFRENLQKRLRALNASDAELKALGREEPYLAAQMLHPVVRNAYRLFAALSPDQQAQLTQGQTPSHVQGVGHMMAVFPLETTTFPRDGGSTTLFHQPQKAPRGDIVTLRPGEMTGEQRAAVEAILRGATAQQEHEVRSPRSPRSLPGAEHRARALKAADPATAVVSLFRWGDPTWQGISLRVQFQSEGKPWAVYSDFALPVRSYRVYDGLIRKGEFEIWPGGQGKLDHFLGGRPTQAEATPANPAPRPGEHPDPVLDAPITFTWRLPLRGSRRVLEPGELLALLHREIRRPVVVDATPEGMPRTLELPAAGSGEFHWEGRPLRALLHRFFPGLESEVEGGAVFLRDPERLRGRWNQMPAAVEQFLKGLQRPFTLDDMALLARSLTPWQIVKLQPYLPQEGVDQLQAAQELLKLYGELAPAQRQALRTGLSFTALTPTQQALFVQFAQRQRPFLEPWRFQEAALRLRPEPPPAPDLPRGLPPSLREQTVTARTVFEVLFPADDVQRLPVDLYTPRKHTWDEPLGELVGRPFPFPNGPETIKEEDGTVWQPPFAGLAVRGKPLVLVIARSHAEPYVGPQPPPPTTDWSRSLARRLRPQGVTVLQVTTSAEVRQPAPERDAAPNWIHRVTPGTLNGAALDGWDWATRLRQFPTVFVIGADETVRAVFEGPAAWDAAAVEHAARALTVTGAPTR